MSSESLRVALYIRVSTEEQAREGLSLGAQEDRLKTYAETNQMTVVDVYRDAGFSARKNPHKRPEFARLMRDVQEERFDMILFIKLDRWFRNVADYYKVQEVLDRHNVAWKTTEEDYDTTTTGGRLNLNIRLAIAQDEADRTSDRIKFVFEKKVAAGEPHGGTITYGYKIENKRLVPDPETAPILQEIFNVYEMEKSLARTIERIRNEYGKASSYTNMRYILMNETYIGKRHDNHNFCDPLISKDQFERVANIMKTQGKTHFGKKTKSGNIYLFSGLLKCSVCGSRMSATYTHPPGYNYYAYYRCPNHHHKRGCTQRFKVREDKIEAYLLDNLSRLLNKQIDEVKQIQSQSKKKSNKSQIMRKIARLQELFVNELLSLEEFKKQRSDLLGQIIEPEENEMQIIKLGQLEDAVHSGALEMYDQLAKEKQQAFWRDVIEFIHIYPDGRYDVFFV